MIPAVVERCAGIDVHKKFVTVCVLVGAAHLEPEPHRRRFGTCNAELCKLRDWLLAERCQKVAMESTGPYCLQCFGGSRVRGSLGQPAAGEESARAQDGHEGLLVGGAS